MEFNISVLFQFHYMPHTATFVRPKLIKSLFLVHSKLLDIESLEHFVSWRPGMVVGFDEKRRYPPSKKGKRFGRAFAMGRSGYTEDKYIFVLSLI